MAFSSPQGSIRSEINVTPMVDVCLVLLIIFMILMPALVREIPVQLPMTGPGKPASATRPLVVSMLEDQTVMVEKSPVPLEALPGLLRQLKEAEPDRPVMVQGDKRLSYEQLSRLLERLDDAGFNRVGLITVRSAQGG